MKSLAEAPSVTGVILNMFPTNILQAMSEANILQLIVFAIFSGVAILLLKDSDRTRITDIGCAEIAIILQGQEFPVPIIDPNDVIAKVAVRL